VPADVQTLLTIHVLAKIAFGAHDAAATLKLQQHGLAREDLALAAALDAPLQLAGGALAARWAARRPLAPWLAAFAPRMALVALLAALVAVFPAPDEDGRVPRWFFACIVAVQVAQSFAGYVCAHAASAGRKLIVPQDSPVRGHGRVPHSHLRPGHRRDLHDSACS
jgi:PAT family acetyl-CoA transporter-like MFS transporter 1